MGAGQYTIICFSPTGNAFHLAGQLADRLNVDKKKILPLEFTNPAKLDNNDHLILIYPVHSFNAPKNVKSFTKGITPGLFEKTSLIGVGCVDSWPNWAVSSALRRILIKNNYSIVVDEILAMPLTFIMAFPDDLALEVIAKSEQKIDKLGDAIINNKVSQHKVKFKSHFLNFIGKVEIPAAPLFGLELHANNNCTSCGTCWENCPSGNIKQGKKDKPKFGFSCLMCMRCIYNCPEKAISPRISKFIPLSKGYSLKKYRP